jgi:hypothetical protein
MVGVPKSVDKPSGSESLRRQAIEVAANVAAVEENIPSLSSLSDRQVLTTTGTYLAMLVLKECPENVGSYAHDEGRYPTVVARRSTGTDKWTRETALSWAERTYKNNTNDGVIPDSLKQLIEKGRGK